MVGRGTLVALEGRWELALPGGIATRRKDPDF